MKIIADENIPLVEHYFANLGELILKPGRLVTRQDLLHADVLLVRSVTKVVKELLQGTSVKFVASATNGMDHMDIDWLDQAGISWYVAKGCNSTAVIEYVICVIASLQNQNLLLNKNCRTGVIGCGEIGAQVAKILTFLGFDVIQHDPLRANNEPHFISTPLTQFVDLDFITIHTPLTQTGSYPTFHMINKDFLQRQKTGCVLLNTSRGSVINFAELKTAGTHLHWCLDVWENEPNIDLDIMRASVIATPHIAGYSVQSKYRGTEMLYQAALKQKMIPDKNIAPVEFPTQTISFENKSLTWRDVVLKIFDPEKISMQMKNTLLQANHPEKAFDDLRKNFIDRNEFRSVNLVDLKLNQQDQKIFFSLA